MLVRIAAQESDSVRSYAAEVLAIYLQSSMENCDRLMDKKGMEVLLTCLAAFKRRDPTTADDEEYVENVFDCVCALLTTEKGRAHFIQCEGLELMLLMIKEKKLARCRAFKVLDYAMATPNEQVATRFIRLSGLSGLFSALMQRGYRQLKKAYPSFSAVEETEHVVAVLVFLFRSLPVQSSSEELSPSDRLYLKFMENDYSKLDRLVELCVQWRQRTQLHATEPFQDQLQHGMYTLTMLYVCLVHVMRYALPCKDRCLLLLTRYDVSLVDIQHVLQLYLGNVDATQVEWIERLCATLDAML
jgi:beta-catenin-like protein 1